MALLFLLAACGDAASPVPLAGHCRQVDLVVAGTDRLVAGVEDLAIDAARGVAYLSAYDRRWAGPAGEARPSGGLYRLDLEADLDAGREAASLPVVDLTADFAATAPFFPQGIDLRREPDGTRTLAAINRRHAARSGAAADVAVEVFTVGEGGLTHRATLADPAFCRANDLLLIGPDRMLVTADHAACGGWRHWFELATAYPGGHLVLWQDDAAHRVTQGVVFANGVASAGDQVLVAATRADRLFVYDRTDLETAAGPGGRLARPVGEVALPGGPDNLNWGDDGYLYAAVLPARLRLMLYGRGWLGVETAPSRIVRLSLGSADTPTIVFDAIVSDAIVFDEDEPPLSGITAAAAYRDRLLAGAAWDSGLMICRLDADPDRTQPNRDQPDPG